MSLSCLQDEGWGEGDSLWHLLTPQYCPPIVTPHNDAQKMLAHQPGPGWYLSTYCLALAASVAATSRDGLPPTCSIQTPTSYRCRKAESPGTITGGPIKGNVWVVDDSSDGSIGACWRRPRVSLSCLCYDTGGQDAPVPVPWRWGPGHSGPPPGQLTAPFTVNRSWPRWHPLDWQRTKWADLHIHHLVSSQFGSSWSLQWRTGLVV